MCGVGARVCVGVAKGAKSVRQGKRFYAKGMHAKGKGKVKSVLPVKFSQAQQRQAEKACRRRERRER